MICCNIIQYRKKMQIVDLIQQKSKNKKNGDPTLARAWRLVSRSLSCSTVIMSDSQRFSKMWRKCGSCGTTSPFDSRNWCDVTMALRELATWSKCSEATLFTRASFWEQESLTEANFERVNVRLEVTSEISWNYGGKLSTTTNTFGYEQRKNVYSKMAYFFNSKRMDTVENL